jgi:hypothetical protein
VIEREAEVFIWVYAEEEAKREAKRVQMREHRLMNNPG